MKHILKIALLLLLPFFAKAQYSAISQDKMVAQIRHQSDSIFNLLTKETDENKKVKLILSFFSTSIDGYPLQIQWLSQKLLELARKNNDLVVESSAYSMEGQANRLTGSYAKALERHRKAVATAEKTGNQLLLAFAINQMAHIYKDRLENEKALTLYKESLQMFEKINMNFFSWASMNIGAVYYTMGNYDSSLYYIEDGLKRNNASNSSSTGIISNAYNIIASIYSQKSKPDSVTKYFEMALNLANQSQSPRYLNGTYLAIAEHFNRQQQFDSSAYYYKKAVAVVSGTEMNNLVIKPAKKLTDYYQYINADSTVKYWKVYSAANDSVNSMRTNQQIQQLTSEEDQRKRDIELAQLAYQNKIRMGLLLGGLAVFSLVAIILYRNNRQKQKANLVLQEQKQKIETTLIELKATQSQLIQSEKMASLGELTAGIAHEIQNPLNFVNNFSEVSAELLAEMQDEINKGNLEDAKEILTDVLQNLEKINHHGKRADAIVKGMLQHSQSSSGKKEPIDLNALCDEYLRLSYHGLRAKDKSFNAIINTDFDVSIDKVNIIPQDFGRVILNLLNNAFYAVNEKQLLKIEGYEPTVSIATKKENNKIIISVTDNGNGIPREIVHKVFHPFFTTKPTGQGTGLGLSLAYDIVTKGHGGELRVETKECEGSTFIIQLPAIL